MSIICAVLCLALISLSVCAQELQTEEPAEQTDVEQAGAEQPAEQAEAEQPAEQAEAEQPAEPEEAGQPAEQTGTEQPAEQAPAGQPAAQASPEQPAAEQAAAPPPVLLSDELQNWPAGPEIGPQAGCLIDIDTGVILYGKNMHDRHYPASITKVMTALIACEHGEPDQQVVFSNFAVFSIEKGSANVGMKEGEIITLDQALRCLMAASANECANGIAENVGGDFDTFIGWMNEKAADLGCTDTHFVNPHGLHDPDHYVSACDMAKIAAAAYHNEWFRDICHLPYYNRPLTNMNPDDAWQITNRHQMFRQDTDYYYDLCTGGKTGFTNEAGTTLVTFAEKDGMRLCTVVLAGAGVNTYDATRAMMEFGFANFAHLTPKELLGEEVISDDGGSFITVPAGFTADDLNKMVVLEEGSSGTVSFSYQGISLGECKVTFTDSYVSSLRPAPPEEEVTEPESDTDVQENTEKPKNSVTQKALEALKMIPWQIYAGAGGVLVLILILIIAAGSRKKKKKKRKN